MARYAAEQIYGFARKAGFSPDQAATMTAVALAESGGNSRAHNPSGEDSRGLWQINARAHPDLAQKYDLYDPLQNARAAFEVSRQGTDITPWTVTHHGSSARYLSHREAAQSAALSYGEGAGRGTWTGTAGYGTSGAAAAVTSTTTVASADGATTTVTTTAPPPVEVADGPGGLRPDSPVHAFLQAALAQTGDTYVFGAETDLADANPTTFDCSELVQWAAARAGVTVTDGASAQYLEAKRTGSLISVEEAARTPGALLFHFSQEPVPGGGRPSTAHVAISLGNGRTIEARNSKYDVGQFDVGTRFTYAAVLPGLSDPASLSAAALDVQATAAAVAAATDPVITVPAQPLPDLGGADTDHDGLTDLKEQADQLDPLSADTDRDTLPDGWEAVNGTDATLADTDMDLLLDSLEFARGSDPMDPDTDEDGHLDGALSDSWVDTDADGIDDPLERILGFDPLVADSDRDGFVDGLEYRSPSDSVGEPSIPSPRSPVPELEEDAPL